MRSLFAVALVALCVGAAAQSGPAPGFPAVPGLCTGNGGAGIGCGYDASHIEAVGATVNPKRPVVQFDWCESKCYQPAHYYDPDCEGCIYQLADYTNYTYSVPSNVFVLPYTEAGGCYEQVTNDDVDDYMSLVGHTIGHDGWFHSWSKTTVNYYHMYYEKDMSLSLAYKFLIWHTLTLPTVPTPKTTFEFTISVDSLPAAYDNATYRQFIDEWGTHYMDSAHVGGSALMTQYFHSCFLEQMGGKYVYTQSSSSFFGIFNSNDAKKSGFNKTDGKYVQWSNSTIKLLGGAADQYPALNWTDPLNAQKCQAWEDSIKNQMVPLRFSFEPLDTLMTDKEKAFNFQKALVEYGVTIGTFDDQIVDQLKPKDPHFQPPWCHFDPHPPAAKSRRARELAAAAAAAADGGKAPVRRIEALKGQAIGSLNPCPSLPSGADAARALKERAARVAEARRLKQEQARA